MLKEPFKKRSLVLGHAAMRSSPDIPAIPSMVIPDRSED